jgi:DNA repair protein RadC
LRVIESPLEGHATTSVAGVEAAEEFFAPVFAATGKNLFAVALCDVQARALTLLSYPEAIQLAEFSVQPLVSRAVRSGCAGLVVAHNYARPWGKPIAADIDLAGRLAKATEPLEITLVDYLLLGPGPPFSFRRADLL